MKKNRFKYVPIMFLVSDEAFLHKKRSERSIFGRCLESSKNDPKLIGICPESLISRLGIA